MAKLTEVVGVVRSFKDPGIGKFVTSLLNYLPHVVVVVEASLDQGYTKELLGKECAGQSNNIHIVEALGRDGGRSWSALLNTGLTFVKGMNACGAGFRYLFNISNTTMFQEHHVQEMVEGFDTPSVGIVGTSFVGVSASGEDVALGASYNASPRNTGMIIDMHVFDSHPQLCGFDTWYDGKNGMEDYAFVLTAKAIGWKVKLQDLQVPVKVGVHWNQEEKERFMAQGMQDVRERMTALGF